MTLPANGPLSLFQICDEFSLPHTSVFPGAFYGLGGAPAAGALSFADFYGRSALTFDVPPGNYTDSGGDSASFSIHASVPVVWTWIKTSGSAGASAGTSSGNPTATGWEANCPAGPGFPSSPRSAVYDVTASFGGVDYHWTITLHAEGNA